MTAEDSVYSEKTHLLSKPKITIKRDTESITIHFDQNPTQAIRLFCKRSEEKEFSLLSEVRDLSYTDTRPNLFNAPEIREYMAYYVDNDTQTGQSSDTVLIIKK